VDNLKALRRRKHLTQKELGALTVNIFTREIKRVEPANDGRGSTHLLLSEPPRELYVRQSDTESKRLMGEP